MYGESYGFMSANFPLDLHMPGNLEVTWVVAPECLILHSYPAMWSLAGSLTSLGPRDSSGEGCDLFRFSTERELTE